MKREIFQPTSLESFNVRERHELFDEDSRHRAALIRIGTEHQERVEAIKARFDKARREYLVASLEAVS